MYIGTVLQYQNYWEKQMLVLKILYYPYIAEMEILCLG